VASIDLHATAGTTVDHGNTLGLESSWTGTDGTQHAVADVWFAQKAAPAPTVGELLAPAPTNVLPEPAGAQAAVQDGSLCVAAVIPPAVAVPSLQDEQHLHQQQLPLI
jgi:hypothetical protein